MDRTVFITGGAGFLGSALTRKFLDERWKVAVYDNFFTGRREFLPRHASLAVERGDICSARQLRRALAKHRPCAVAHLAAIPFIPYGNAHTSEVFRVNTLATQILLEELARMKPAPQFLFASSAAVYKKSAKRHTETDAVGPLEMYGVSKLSSEFCVRLFHQAFGSPCFIARIFNAVGPRTTNPYLVPTILKMLKSGGRKITLGNLSPVRDYVYVDDVAGALYAIVNSGLEGCRVFNVGTGRGHSVAEVAKTAVRYSGRKAAVTASPERMRKVDRPVMVANIARIKKLGWEPKNSMRDSIRKTMAYNGFKTVISKSTVL